MKEICEHFDYFTLKKILFIKRLAVSSVAAICDDNYVKQSIKIA